MEKKGPFFFTVVSYYLEIMPSTYNSYIYWKNYKYVLTWLYLPYWTVGSLLKNNKEFLLYIVLCNLKDIMNFLLSTQ